MFAPNIGNGIPSWWLGLLLWADEFVLSFKLARTSEATFCIKLVYFKSVSNRIRVIFNPQIPNRIVGIRDRCRCVIHWAVDRLRNSWCRLIHRLYYCRCRCIHRFDSLVGRLSNDRFYRGVGRLSHHRLGHWVDNGCLGAAGVAFIGRCRCVGLSCVLDRFALIKNFSLKSTI